MSATLKFKAADVLRCCEHAMKSTDWTAAVLDYGNKANGWTPTRAKPEPGVVLVHDSGVYLMSNGKPRDLISGDQENGHSFVAYAEGMNPNVDAFDDWYDAAQRAVGGDDFAEHITGDFFRAIHCEAMRGGVVKIRITKNSMRLVV